MSIVNNISISEIKDILTKVLHDNHVFNERRNSKIEMVILFHTSDNKTIPFTHLQSIEKHINENGEPYGALANDESILTETEHLIMFSSCNENTIKHEIYCTESMRAIYSKSDYNHCFTI